MSETKQQPFQMVAYTIERRRVHKIHQKFSKSTCRKLSEYARRVLLDKTDYS